MIDQIREEVSRDRKRGARTASSSVLLRPHRRRPDSEGDEARQGGDGDGDAGVLHGEAEALLQRQFGAAGGGFHVPERLRRHEHVVDS